MLSLETPPLALRSLPTTVFCTGALWVGEMQARAVGSDWLFSMALSLDARIEKQCERCFSPELTWASKIINHLEA